jgi:hypothetical protein
LLTQEDEFRKFMMKSEEFKQRKDYQINQILLKQQTAQKKREERKGFMKNIIIVQEVETQDLNKK